MAMIRRDRCLIRTEALKKIYKDNGLQVEALRGVDLTVHSAEFTAIAGPSGSGKTTLLNIISGLDKPTEGKVWLDGKLMSDMNDAELSDFRRDHIGFIFQSFNLIPVLSVEENIEYIMLLQKVPREERSDRVHEILREVDLEGFARRFPPRLSGGQQQRVAIARAMVSRPLMILADEATANLDSRTGADLLDMMRRLNEARGITFIFSTHDQMIMDKARRIVIIRDGRIDHDETRA
jgi:putative ABC transport system ATP-binding protein